MIVNGLNSAYGVIAAKVAGEAFKVENAQLKYWLEMGDNPVAERLEKSANATPTNAHVRSCQNDLRINRPLLSPSLVLIA